jgi:glycosyltransferase involved in cell wall biosynthesis
MTTGELKYVIVSPVKDEAKFVEATLQSVTDQTRKPERWVIVDDGSKDETRALIRKYASFNFIQVIETNRTARREPGTGVIRAFNHGYDAVKDGTWDVIVKLDCDLEFPPDYFERILTRMEADPRLGIVSGVYSELQSSGEWRTIEMPAYHAAGACKVIRRDCFEQIEGFVCSRGWDTVDEIRAMNLGWKTTHFPDLVMRHLKPEGSGVGTLRTCVLHGEVYYRTGGGPLFFAAKLLHRALQKPPFIGAAALAYGYLKPRFNGSGLLVSKAEASLYNSLLRQRLLGRKTTSIS